MSNDIRDILSRLTALEGKITPTTVKKGLNPQQDSVPQMPALFKPKKISVLGSGTDPQHPAKGMAVGSNESTEPAGNKLAETMANIEEDMLSKVKKDLTTYLDKLEQKVKSDPDLMAKAVDGVEDENPAKAGKQSSHNDQEEVDENDYRQIMDFIAKLYKKAKLVHGDLSEYNVFKTENGLIVFDFGSAVDTIHPNAQNFLERDIKNMSYFFAKRGLTVENPVDVLAKIQS